MLIETQELENFSAKTFPFFLGSSSALFLTEKCWNHLHENNLRHVPLTRQRDRSKSFCRPYGQHSRKYNTSIVFSADRLIWCGTVAMFAWSFYGWFGQRSLWKNEVCLFSVSTTVDALFLIIPAAQNVTQMVCGIKVQQSVKCIGDPTSGWMFSIEQNR